MNDDQKTILALRCLSHHQRWAIVGLCRGAGVQMKHLGQILAVGKPAMTVHVARLVSAGLAVTHQVGTAKRVKTTEHGAKLYRAIKGAVRGFK